MLDAAHQLSLPSPAAAALLASPAAAGALSAICSRALGRTSSPDVRLAALHALASIAGLERAGEARDRTAALMTRGAEDVLRQAVFGAVSGQAGGAGGAWTPAEAVWQLLQQPFDETRTGVYRWVWSGMMMVCWGGVFVFVQYSCASGNAGVCYVDAVALWYSIGYECACLDSRPLMVFMLITRPKGQVASAHATEPLQPAISLMRCRIAPTTSTCCTL